MIIKKNNIGSFYLTISDCSEINVGFGSYELKFRPDVIKVKFILGYMINIIGKEESQI